MKGLLRGRLRQAIAGRMLNARLRWFQYTHRLAAEVDRSFRGGLAVICPCYNHATFLDATLTSIANQTYRPFEAIFVEDHSTDKTWEHLNQLCQHLPNGIRPILLRTPKNFGQASAINLGVKMSNASIFTVINDDDYLMHDALEAITEILRRHPDVYRLGTTSVRLSEIDFSSGGDEKKCIRSAWLDYDSIPLTKYVPTYAHRFFHPNDLNMTHSGSTFFKTAWQAVGGYYSDKNKRAWCTQDEIFKCV